MSGIWWSGAMIDDLLAEDTPFGDLTTCALGIGDKPANLTMAVRAEAVVCGSEVAHALFIRAGAEGQVLVPTGSAAAAGAMILEAYGPAEAIHRAWKVSQTLIEYLSGIATATEAIVRAAKSVSPDIAVVTTRKTFPGSKRLMIAAIKAGGALPHRLSLSETVLVFPEHRAFLADPAAAVAELRRALPEKKVVVEVASIAEAEGMLAARPDVLQCEKMHPDEIAQVVVQAATLSAGTLVAAAGGVNASNAAAYAAAGAHILVTSAPYWAKPVDVKVVITPR